MYLYMAHLNKKSQGAESQQNENVFRSRLNSLRHVSLSKFSQQIIPQPRSSNSETSIA